VEDSEFQLEYHCTAADSEEAQALFISHPDRRFLKWRTRILEYVPSFCFLAVLIFSIITRRLPKALIVVLGIALPIAIALVVWKKLNASRKNPELLRLIVSVQGLAFASGSSDTTGTATKSWSSFGQCLESPNLFVLIDRPGMLLFIIPKRAFPGEAAQNWFRARANRAPNEVHPTAEEAESSAQRPAPDGQFEFTFQYRFLDYLNRTLTTWRMRGIVLAVLLLTSGICLVQAFFPSSTAVNSPAKVFLIMISIIIPMLVVILILITALMWFWDRKYRNANRVTVGDKGMRIVRPDGETMLPWAAYKYYLENRLAFFVWNPAGSIWLMVPKRSFRSATDETRFRELLRSNLKASIWFCM